MVAKDIHWHLLDSPSSSKKKLLGDYPQVTKMNSNFIFYDYYKIPDNYEIPYFVGSKKAKPTDFIFSMQVPMSTAFIVNEKVKSILDDFKLSNHLLMKTFALFGSEKITYYVYYFFTENIEYIDFKNTNFRIHSFLDEYKTELKESINLKIENYEMLMNENNKLDPDKPSIVGDPICLLDGNGNLDLIKLKKCPYSGIFINSDLKNILIKNNIHGFALRSEKYYFLYGINKSITF